MAKHNQTGRIGEDVAGEFLKRKGFKIISKNYRKPYGELDLVALKSKIYHFIEVKTVSWETVSNQNLSVSHETKNPEENIHPQKIERLKRIIQSYLVSHEIESEWQFDVISVFLDQKTKTAKVRYLEDVIL